MAVVDVVVRVVLSDPVFASICNNILDPVGSTVRYEMMKLCSGSV